MERYVGLPGLGFCGGSEFEKGGGAPFFDRPDWCLEVWFARR